MTDSDQFAYIVTCLVAAATPGPGTLAVLNSSIVSGFRKTLPLMVGIITGMGVIAILTMCGLSIIVMKSEIAFRMVQYTGGAYIMYLGCKAFLDSRNAVFDADVFDSSSRFTFKSGLLLSTINPKTIIFFTSLLPLFINSEHSLLNQNISLTMILLLCTFSVHVVYAKLGSYISPFVSAKIRMIEFCTGILFISIAFFIIIGLKH